MKSLAKYTPHIVAIVQLDDGSRLLTHITSVTPKTLKVGMRVQVVSHQVTENRIVYKLKPTEKIPRENALFTIKTS